MLQRVVRLSSSRLLQRAVPRLQYSTENQETKTEEPKPEEKKAEETVVAKIEVDAAEWESKIKEAKECRDKMLYALAEAQNVRRRSEDEVERVRKYASQSFAKDVLDVADNLQIALKATEDSGATKVMGGESVESKALKSLYDGLVLTHKLILTVLNNNHVSKIEALGSKFDPNVHEALFEVPDESKEAGTVAVVMKDGYMYKDRVLRPAKVGTVKARE